MHTKSLLVSTSGQVKREEKGLRRRTLTSMSAQMTSEGIAPPAGVAAEGAFEGFFTCMEFDVS